MQTTTAREQVHTNAAHIHTHRQQTYLRAGSCGYDQAILSRGKTTECMAKRGHNPGTDITYSFGHSSWSHAVGKIQSWLQHQSRLDTQQYKHRIRVVSPCTSMSLATLQNSHLPRHYTFTVKYFVDLYM